MKEGAKGLRDARMGFREVEGRIFLKGKTISAAQLNENKIPLQTPVLRTRDPLFFRN